MKAEDDFIDHVIRWHQNNDLHDAVMGGLATLMRMGHAEQSDIEAAPLDYIRKVCAIAAAAVSSMPAVQRALALAHPGFNKSQCYEELVRAFEKVFVLEEDSVLSAIRPQPSQPQPQADLPAMPAGLPVN